MNITVTVDQDALIEWIPKEAAVLSSLSEQDHHLNLVKYHGWGRVARREMITARYEKIYCFTGMNV